MEVDSLINREQFAVKLRREKKQLILSKKRVALFREEIKQDEVGEEEYCKLYLNHRFFLAAKVSEYITNQVRSSEFNY